VPKLSKKTPYLVIKGGRFYFRIRIPDDIHQAFGKKEHTEALADINRAQADVRAAQLGAHWQANFLEERHRQGRALSPPVPSPEAARIYRTATLDEVKAVAATVAHRMLAEDEELRIEGLPWWRDLEESPEFGMGQPFGAVVADAVAGRNLAGLKERAEENLSVLISISK
jgi:hypothetical protein